MARIIFAFTVCCATLLMASNLLMAEDIFQDDFEGSAPVNQPPTAQAGPDQSVQAGTGVTLNGSSSSDPDSNPLTYQWTLTTAPTYQGSPHAGSVWDEARQIL